MKTSSIPRIFLAFPLLIVGSCASEDVPTAVQYHPEVEIVLNDGKPATNLSLVSVRVFSVDADSVLIWNDCCEEGTEQWFAFVDSVVSLPGWDIGSVEGEVLVDFQFTKHRVLSDIHQVGVVLDLTAPHLLPVPVFPADAQQECANGLSLQWSAAADNLAGASDLRYTVFVGDGSTPDVEVWSGTGTRCLVPGLEPGTGYTWRVDVQDEAGNSATGEVSTFGTWAWDLPAMVLVPAGTFQMGSPETELGRFPYELQHQVTLTHDYLMAETELTWGQCAPVLQWAYDRGFISVRNDTVFDARSAPEVVITYLDEEMIYFQGGIFLAGWRDEQICMKFTWYGAVEMGEWLNGIAGYETGLSFAGDWDYPAGDPYTIRGFRLATEAEWEYACRAGSTTAFANGEFGGNPSLDLVLDEIGWYYGNFRHYNGEPKLKIPNAWGLYDMHGGNPEWCWDWTNFYPEYPVVDPVNECPTIYLIPPRALRGCSHVSAEAWQCRSGYRDAREQATGRFSDFAIRLVYAGD
jgi:formylglycine-generating enzyme required for sulfatase activity